MDIVHVIIPVQWTSYYINNLVSFAAGYDPALTNKVSIL